MRSSRIIRWLKPQASAQIDGGDEGDQTTDVRDEVPPRRNQSPEHDRNRKPARDDSEQMQGMTERAHPRTPSCTTAPA